MRENLVRGFLGIFAALFLSTAAQADFGGPAFSITASNADGEATFTADFVPGGFSSGGQEYTWSLGEGIDLISNQGRHIARLEGALVYYHQDPIVALGFLVLAGNSTTNFSIASATLFFAPYVNPNAQATAGVSLTDINGNAAAFGGNVGNGDSYTAHYNGMPGSTFTTLVPGFNAGAFLTNTNSESFGFAPIAGNVGDMTASWNFSLSANDMASGTSKYELVPEPGTLAALAIGAAALLRRRRR